MKPEGLFVSVFKEEINRLDSQQVEHDAVLGADRILERLQRQAGRFQIRKMRRRQHLQPTRPEPTGPPYLQWSNGSLRKFACGISMEE